MTLPLTEGIAFQGRQNKPSLKGDSPIRGNVAKRQKGDRYGVKVARRRRVGWVYLYRIYCDIKEAFIIKHSENIFVKI